MKTGQAIFISILIAILILTTGLIVYIIILEVNLSESAARTQNPLQSASFQTQDVINENGEAYGQRGYVEITKDDLKRISTTELKKFADEYVKDSPYQWISIIAPDGTGIYFPNASNQYAEYGMLSEDGRTASLSATITLESGIYVFHNAGSSSSTPAANENGSETAFYEENSSPNASYENDWMGIQFTEPDGYMMLTDNELADMVELASEIFYDSLSSPQLDQIITVSEYEMMCAAPEGTPNVSVSSGNLTNSSVTLDQLAETYISALRDAPDISMVSDTVESVMIAGNEFLKVHAIGNVFGIDGAEKNQDYYFAKKDDKFYYICLTYANNETREANILLNAFQAK